MLVFSLGAHYCVSHLGVYVCVRVCESKSTEDKPLGVNGSSLEFSLFSLVLLRTCHPFNIMNV